MFVNKKGLNLRRPKPKVGIKKVTPIQEKEKANAIEQADKTPKPNKPQKKASAPTNEEK
jgi:hypothetical protein